MGNYSTYGWQQILAMTGIMAAVFLGFIVWILYERYRSRRQMMDRIRREWGQVPERDYDPTEFDCISHYYLNKETDEFQIDDITWNDLDMDRIFMQINHTRSFIGESYLYYRLRTPMLRNEKTDEFEELVSWISAHPRQREQLEYFFAKIGKTGRRSVFDYIYNISGVVCGSNAVHYGMIAMILTAVGVLFVNPQPGILLLIAAMGISIWTYERYKKPIAPYVVSCAAIEKILQASEELAKQDVYGVSGEEILSAVAKFKKLRRNMVLLMAGDDSTAKDGLLQGIFLYVNNLFHIDLIQFKTVVRELSGNLQELEYLIDTAGEVEAAIAVSSWRELHPEHTVPVLHESEKVQYAVKNMYHPLIKEPVPNSMNTDRCVLLTGSNASGKSTFLKTAALQTILAQTVHTVTAESYEACFFRTYSSMALRDDLIGEESYYMVEIRSLKRILDRMNGSVPVFCCVDEVLRGTNTVERIAASSQILKRMARENLLCMAATHDIELTYLLEAVYRNCHFEEEITDDSISFDYRLREGRAMTRNAIRLLGLMGFEEEIIREAEKMAAEMGNPGKHE